jgi:M6 family metalloprotease-like protein
MGNLFMIPGARLIVLLIFQALTFTLGVYDFPCRYRQRRKFRRFFQGELDLPSVFLGLNTLKSIYGDTTRGFYTNENVIIPNSCMLPEQEWRIINTTFGSVFLELGMNGIVVGTLGSHLGLPDLFNTSDGTTAIGRFGLMDGQGIFSYLGVFPPEPSAWEKQYLGWVNPITVNSNGTYTSKAASIDFNGNESVYKNINQRKEYFLVENRNRDAFNNGQTVHFVSGGARIQ